MHPSDITQFLQKLVNEDFLDSHGTGRATTYTLKGAPNIDLAEPFSSKASDSDDPKVTTSEAKVTTSPNTLTTSGDTLTTYEDEISEICRANDVIAIIIIRNLSFDNQAFDIFTPIHFTYQKSTSFENSISTLPSSRAGC